MEEIAKSFKKKFGKLNLDLGCGQYPRDKHFGIDNYLGVDIQIGEGQPHYIMDLNENIPLKDMVVDNVFTSHSLEHLRLDHIIPEVGRLLKKGGEFKNIIPYASSAEGMYPGHQIFLTEKWFKESPMIEKYFIIKDISYKETEEYLKLPNKIKEMFPFEIARVFFFQACNEFTITMA